MTNPPKLPMTADDWQNVYGKMKEAFEEIRRNTKTTGTQETLVLNILLGDEYLVDTVNILMANINPLNYHVYEPIEKLLRAVSSPSIRQYLIKLCLQSNRSDAVLTACMLLPELANPDLLPYLPTFAKAINPEVRLCGLSICEELSFRNALSSTQLKACADLFRNTDNEHEAQKVRNLDQLAAKILEEESESATRET